MVDYASPEGERLRAVAVHSAWDLRTLNRITRINNGLRTLRHAFRHLYTLKNEDGVHAIGEADFRERFG